MARPKKRAAQKPTAKAKAPAKKPKPAGRRRKAEWDAEPEQLATQAEAKAKKKPPTKAHRPSAQERQEQARRAAFDAGRKAREEAAAAADLTAGKQLPEALAANQWKPGQSGNPRGRPKGARSKLGEDFIRDLHEAWQANGQAAIEMAMIESPLGFIRIVAGAIPQQVEHSFKDLEDLSDEELDEAIRRGVAALGFVGSALGGAGPRDAGEDDPGAPAPN